MRDAPRHVPVMSAGGVQHHLPFTNDAASDDQRSIGELREAVHTWLTVDTSIAVLQAGLRERRAFKQQLTDRILVLMRQMEVKNLEIADHHCVLRYKVTRVRAPLQPRLIQARLRDFYASDPVAERAMEANVFSPAEPVERVQLRKGVARGGPRLAIASS